MIGSLQKLVESFDRLSQAATRLGAQRISRRSALSALGTAIAGGAIFPMLPFDRSGSAQAANTRDEGDETCEYWRYCALDGFLWGKPAHDAPSSAVLSMRTPRSSTAGQPWLTGATWPGWPFPQLNAPPST